MKDKVFKILTLVNTFLCVAAVAIATFVAVQVVKQNSKEPSYSGQNTAVETRQAVPTDNSNDSETLDGISSESAIVTDDISDIPDATESIPEETDPETTSPEETKPEQTTPKETTKPKDTTKPKETTKPKDTTPEQTTTPKETEPAVTEPSTPVIELPEPIEIDLVVYKDNVVYVLPDGLTWAEVCGLNSNEMLERRKEEKQRCEYTYGDGSYSESIGVSFGYIYKRDYENAEWFDFGMVDCYYCTFSNELNYAFPNKSYDRYDVLHNGALRDINYYLGSYSTIKTFYMFMIYNFDYGDLSKYNYTGFSTLMYTFRNEQIQSDKLIQIKINLVDKSQETCPYDSNISLNY